jgi:protein-export membrane protein SecD
MSSIWKYKAITFAIAILLSVYFLLPSILHVKDKVAELEKQGKKAPWYYEVLPQKELNLGLDLRGGLYLELEVDVKEAMRHQVDLLVGEIKQFVFKDDLTDRDVRRVGTKILRVEVLADQRDAFMSELKAVKGADVFQQLGSEREVFFKILTSPEAARQQVLQGLKNLGGFDGADVTSTQDGKYLALPFSDGAQKQALILEFSKPDYQTDFSLVTGDMPNVMYLEIADSYFEYLERDTIEQAANAVRNRIDRFGVVEASVSRQSNNRLVVELPGIKDPESIINIIRRTGKLEFRIVDDSKTRGELQSLIDSQKSELKIQNEYEKENLAKLNSALKSELPAESELAFQLVRDAISKKVTKALPFLIKKQADVTGDMLENVSVQSENNQPYVSMSFDKVGTKQFGDLTSNHVGKNLAIILDGVVMSAPSIESGITGGQAMIKLGYGSYEALQKEASELVLILKEGALPASLAVASKNVIGPSLGQDSIDAGLRSLLMATLVVIVFMIVYYKLSGVVANVALLFNVLFIFAVLCLFQASLTLPGIAGIVLTMGMAVDANVIIFERMREERFLGKEPGMIVESGYSNAMSAIIDGNITTFIAGVILFQFGSGPIKGFAVTLMIGIVTTMITAILVTRLVYDWFLYSAHVKRISV